MRTALLADKLLERGHSVYWWASTFEHQRKTWISNNNKKFTINKHYTIHALRGCGYKKNISLLRYLDHLLIARKFKSEIRNVKRPDIIVASTPCYHLAFESVRYANRIKVPVIVDIRDLWPDTFLSPLKNDILIHLAAQVLRRDFHKVSLLLNKADALTAMSQGCLDWGLTKCGRAQTGRDRVFYLGYKKRRDDTRKVSNSKVSTPPAKKIFLFIGTFGESYELDLILKVARKFIEIDRTDIVFMLAGTGQKYETIKKRAVGLSNVVLTGWLEEPELHRRLDQAWAGLVPCKSVENAAPNKVFEYLSAGLPLISSLEGEIAALIENNHIGLNYRSGDAQSLFEAVQQLATQGDLKEKMAKNSRLFFTQHGDADTIYSAYVDFIEALAKGKTITPN